MNQPIRSKMKIAATHSPKINKAIMLMMVILLNICVDSISAQTINSNTGGVSIVEGTTPPDPSAVLDVISVTKGLLIPRVDKSALHPTGIGNLIPAADGLTVFVTAPSTERGYWFYDKPAGGWVKMGGGGDGLWTLHTNGMDIYRLNGNVGIGIDAPTSKLHVTSPNNTLLVEKPAGSQGYSIKATGGFGLSSCELAKRVSPGFDYGVYAVGQEYGGYFESSEGYGIYSEATSAGFFNGNLSYTGTLSHASDIKFKDKIENYGGALSKIMQIKAHTYNFKHDGESAHFNFPKDKQIGFIAQEMESILPEFVKDETFALQEEDVNGKPKKITYKSINYVGLVPVLTAAVQEQQAIIENQQKIIEQLQRQNADLIKRIETLEKK